MYYNVGLFTIYNISFDSDFVANKNLVPRSVANIMALNTFILTFLLSFGTIKRTMGFYYLLLRGFKKVRGEISLVIFTYNLKREINILGVERLLESLLANIYIYFLRKNKKITIAA